MKWLDNFDGTDILISLWICTYGMLQL